MKPAQLLIKSSSLTSLEMRIEVKLKINSITSYSRYFFSGIREFLYTYEMKEKLETNLLWSAKYMKHIFYQTVEWANWNAN